MNNTNSNTNSNAPAGAALGLTPVQTQCKTVLETAPHDAQRMVIALYGKLPYLKYRTCAVMEKYGLCIPRCHQSKSVIAAELVKLASTGDADMMMHLEGLLQTYRYAVEQHETGNGEQPWL